MADNPLGRSVRHCVYDGCRWEYDELVPEFVAADGGYLDPATSLRQIAAVTEAAITAHLDADHPGWTLAEVQRRSALDRLITEYEAEHGTITDEELARLESEWIS